MPQKLSHSKPLKRVAYELFDSCMGMLLFLPVRIMLVFYTYFLSQLLQFGHHFYRTPENYQVIHSMISYIH